MGLEYNDASSSSSSALPGKRADSLPDTGNLGARSCNLQCPGCGLVNCIAYLGLGQRAVKMTESPDKFIELKDKIEVYSRSFYHVIPDRLESTQSNEKLLVLYVLPDARFVPFKHKIEGHAAVFGTSMSKRDYALSVLTAYRCNKTKKICQILSIQRDVCHEPRFKLVYAAFDAGLWKVIVEKGSVHMLIAFRKKMDPDLTIRIDFELFMSLRRYGFLSSYHKHYLNFLLLI